MSLEVMLNAPKHPARDVAIISARAAQEQDKETWLAMFSEDAVIEDPVGPSLMDEAGKGHKGPEAREAFYDNYIGATQVRFQIRQTIACGNECVNVGTINTKSADGTVAWTELIMHYIINDDGKLINLRAYWEIEKTMATMF